MPDFRIKIKKNEIEIEVQGSENFVNDKIAELEKKYFGKDGITKHIETTVSEGTKKFSKSLASLIREKGPKSMSEEALIAAYYLDRIGKSKFTVKELDFALQEARRKRPANLNDTINLNISKGFLISAGDKDNLRAWVITAEGSDYVDKMIKE